MISLLKIEIKNRMNVHSVFLSFLFSLIFISNSTAQQNSNKKIVKLLGADETVFDKSYLDAQRVRGNVRFVYEGTFFYCDSAHIFKNDDFDAFGKIVITKPGSFQLTGGFLHVDQKKKTADITSNVVLRDNQMTLTTQQMTYFIDKEIANYYGGGKIVSTANKNVLTSQTGAYNTNTETFFFKKNVVLKNPDYTVYSDTLKYVDPTEISYFFGPTRIVGDDTEIYCENGWYDSKKDISQFNKHAWVRSEKTILKGDSIYYNGEKNYGEVFRNVSIRDTTTSVVITGEYGIHREKTKESLVTERALLTQIFDDGDTLYMNADTLKSLPDSAGKDVLYAFRSVKIFKSDVQALCDSLVYEMSDSALHFFKSPVLWSSANQITGDTIHITNKNNKIDKLFVRSNSFIASVADPSKFNQIKGRNMDASFLENELSEVHVQGNGQMVYFPEEKKDSLSKPQIIGLNKGICSNIHIKVKDQEVKRIRLERDSDSKFSPLKMADQNNFLLEGLLWRQEERPRRKEDVIPALNGK
jgi:lipopolysaccharide export system protein LptA